MSAPPALPVDDLLAPLQRELARHRAVVIEAPPGAGKTTRVPRALLEAGIGGDREIWVAEPRRVAARMAASRVAQEMGVELGGLVGYSVRFEEKSSAQTRLRFVTEGVLSERLVSQGRGRALGAVVLDEFHERHLATDLNLMLLRRRLAEGADLRLVVMSATLDGAAVSAHLGGCPRLTCEGRLYPLAISHEVDDDRPLESRVASAVRRIYSEQAAGDVLIFLPGQREIEKARTSLAGFAQERDLELLPLHGEMSLEAQSRAVALGRRRKVVLSTNVAESSITVEGVTAVVDSGLARIAVDSPWTGRRSLEVRPISQASAVQRAGRAGRTQPGRVIRLFSEADFRARAAQDKPELQRLDLAGVFLAAYRAGAAPEIGDWLDPPAEAAVESARQLLARLGFLANGRLTPLGQRAALLPVSPRLARVALEGERLGVAERAALAAAVLEERDIRLDASGREHPDLIGVECDVDQRIELYGMCAAERFSSNSMRRLGLAPSRVQSVRQSHQQLCRALQRGRSERDAGALSGGADEQRALSLCLLAGFPERVARRKSPGSRELILASGHVAQLSEQSVVRTPPLLLAVDAEDRVPYARAGAGRPAPRGIQVRIASPLNAEWLLDHAAEGLSEREEVVWDDARERALLRSQLCWGAVVLDQSERPAPPGPAVAPLLAKAAQAQRKSLPNLNDAVDALAARVELLRTHLPSSFSSLPSLDGAELLLRACQNHASLTELRELDFRELFVTELGPAARAALERETPEWITLSRGRRVRVRYEAGKPPWLASRLQDFFGMSEGPKLCGGRVPITLHLLAPNQRAVQVTTDLSGFWERHYPSLRRELMRRYPKHAWPEDAR